jgi:hypothetical protein
LVRLLIFGEAQKDERQMSSATVTAAVVVKVYVEEKKAKGEGGGYGCCFGCIALFCCSKKK